MTLHVYPNLQEVEQASALQRRLYRTLRETMRAMAGRLSGVARWEAKQLLARHIWLDAWKEWIAERHRTGQHGYEPFLPRIEARCAQMPPPEHPECFRPLGSSTATTSYATPQRQPVRSDQLSKPDPGRV